MTIDERISKIENALISAGLMESDPSPTREQIMKDILSGDMTSFKAFCVSEFKKGNKRPLEKIMPKKKNGRGRNHHETTHLHRQSI